jgi:hypothetical protein
MKFRVPFTKNLTMTHMKMETHLNLKPRRSCFSSSFGGYTYLKECRNKKC